MDAAGDLRVPAPVARASVRQRLAAGLIDWSFALVAPLVGTSIVVSVVADRDAVIIVAIAGYVVLGAWVVAYFARGLSRGGTVGMRVCGLAVRDGSSGSLPRLRRALPRAILSLFSAAAIVFSVIFAFSDPPDDGYPSGATIAIAAALTLNALTLFGHMVMAMSGRSLQERLFRLAIVGVTDHATAATPASHFGRRFAAGLVDWILCGFATLIMAMPVGGLAFALAEESEHGGGLDPVVEGVLFVGLVAAIAAPTVLYFTLFWTRRGATIGMRAAGIRIVEAKSGIAPRPLKAWLRALLAFVSATTGWLAIAIGLDPEARSIAELAVASVTSIIAALAVIGHLWQLRDSRHRTLQDKLFGLAVVPRQ